MILNLKSEKETKTDKFAFTLLLQLWKGTDSGNLQFLK